MSVCKFKGFLKEHKKNCGGSNKGSGAFAEPLQLSELHHNPIINVNVFSLLLASQLHY